MVYEWNAPNVHPRQLKVSNGPWIKVQQEEVWKHILFYYELIINFKKRIDNIQDDWLSSLSQFEGSLDDFNSSLE